MTGHPQHHLHHIQERTQRLAVARTLVGLVDDLGIRPASLVDVGCGYGFFVASGLQQWQLNKYVGVDGYWIDVNKLEFPSANFIATDLAQPFTFPEQRFDLCVSLEVAEHLPEASASGFIASLVSMSDVVFFSAAIPGQGGVGHVNEQYGDYWARLFAAYGYLAVDALHPVVWDRDDIFPWFRANVILFVKAQRIQDFPSLLPYVTRPALLRRVHPLLYERALSVKRN